MILGIKYNIYSHRKSKEVKSPIYMLSFAEEKYWESVKKKNLIDQNNILS